MYLGKEEKQRISKEKKKQRRKDDPA